MNRTCPDCEQRLDLHMPSCPRCGHGARSLPAPAVRSVLLPQRARRLPVRVQVAAQLDRTGSSLAFERGVRNGLAWYLKALAAQCGEVRVWLASHGDLDYHEPHVMHVENDSPAAALQAAGRVVFEGGGDAAESHLDGIATTLGQVPWAHDGLTRKTMISFLNGPAKPARTGLTAERIGQQIRAAHILFYLIAEPDPALEALSAAAGGQLVPISNDPHPADLRRATARVTQSLTATIAGGGTLPMPVRDAL